MNNIIYIACIVFGVLLAGCCHEEESKENDMVRSFQSDFRQNQEFMMHGGTNCALFARDIANRLWTLPDDKTRIKCVKEWTHLLLHLDLTEPSLIQQRGQLSTCWKVMQELFEITLRCHISSLEERMKLQIQYLEWCRSQVEKMSNVPPYPKGVRRRITSYGYERWEIDNTSQEEFKKFRSQLARYNFLVNEYEEHLRNRELKFSHYCMNKGFDIVQRATSQLETYLGRNVRTESQCMDYFDTKCHVEFPILIPTTNGLQKRWKPKAIGFYSY